MNFTRDWSTVRRHWRLLAGIGLLAAVASAVFSGPSFMHPRYRSQAVVYPVNISTYSIESESDQLMQLLESNSIRDSLIARFRLVEHYGIDTSKAEGHSLMRYMFSERVKIEKTRYESVDIRVTDEDPVLARDMVQAVLDQGNQLARRLQRGKSAELLAVVRQDLARTRRGLDSVEARLDTLRRSTGLLDYDAQTEELTRGYMKALARNAGQAPKAEIAGMLKALQDHGGEFQRLALLNQELIAEYAKKQAQERQLLLDVSKELTYTNVVVHPEVSDKKVYPIRWLIVLASTTAALLLGYLLVSLGERQNGGPGVVKGS